MQPADAAGMAKILAPLGSAITADPGAHHYRLVGLEIAPTPGVYLTNVIDLGSDARTQESLAHHLSFERCYIHGDPAKGSRRGIALNSAETTVVELVHLGFQGSRRRLAGDRRAGTGRVRSTSSTTSCKVPAKTCSSAAPIPRFPISCPATSRSAAIRSRSRCSGG